MATGAPAPVVEVEPAPKASGMSDIPKSVAELLQQIRLLAAAFMANPIETSFTQTIVVVRTVLSDPLMKRIYGPFIVMALKASQYPKPLLTFDEVGASTLPMLDEIENEPAKVADVLQYLQTTFKDPSSLAKVQKNMADALQDLADKAAALPIIKALLDLFPFYSKLIVTTAKSSFQGMLVKMNYPEAVTPLLPVDYEAPTMEELVESPQLLGKLFAAIASKMAESVQAVRPAVADFIQQLSKLTASDIASMTSTQIEQFLDRVNYPEVLQASFLSNQTWAQGFRLPTREEIVAQPTKLVELLEKLKEVQLPKLPEAPVSALRKVSALPAPIPGDVV
eukprot:scaffold1328_cov394-Prasinococcus_capsulatus_cf.AAC.42